MGMYTELHLNVEIDFNAPDEVVAILQYMTTPAPYPLFERLKPDFGDVLSKHELFLTDRWRSMLMMDSYYFPTQTHSAVVLDWPAKAKYLSVRSNLKNYDGEIEKFCDWIRPYSVDRGFVGYKRYEEEDHPTLIYFKDDYVKYINSSMMFGGVSLR